MSEPLDWSFEAEIARIMGDQDRVVSLNDAMDLHLLDDNEPCYPAQLAEWGAWQKEATLLGIAFGHYNELTDADRQALGLEDDHDDDDHDHDHDHEEEE